MSKLLPADANQCLYVFKVSFHPIVNGAITNNLRVLFTEISRRQNEVTLNSGQHLCRCTRNFLSGPFCSIQSVCVPPSFCEPRR